MMIDRDYWYLASPYTKYIGGRVVAYTLAVEAASLLSECGGVKVFSPIAHTHPMAEMCEVKGGHDFWMGLDYPLLDKAKGVIVLMLDGWQDSRGVSTEIGYAQGARKPIVYMTPGEVPRLSQYDRATQDA
jgi:nucleoside 2-deoxyribosyltransferase